MKAAMAGAAWLLLLPLHALALAGEEPQTPIARVVKLLQGLSLKSEMELKKEEDLYLNFVCWAKSVIDSKTASNVAATARMQSLQTYIDDVTAGRVEFTSERADAEKELAGVLSEIEEATALREREKGEFAAAEAEITQALAALEEAQSVLKEATAGDQGASLAQRSSQSLEQRLRQGADLSLAVSLAKRRLTAGDALFLHRLLTGEVPEVDYKKLNRKATFKQKYEARSTKIQDVLKEMQQTFQENLAAATATETKAQEQFATLMTTKKAEQEAAESALRTLEKETGARELAKEDAESEVAALQEQVANDSKFIEQTQAALDEKNKEWGVRKTLRTEEIAAFGKAIEVLQSDDARDLTKRSLASQGYSLLQVQASTSAGATLRLPAAQALRQAAGRANSSRLSALALRVGATVGSHFNEVVQSIGKMVQDLEAEDAEDLLKKEQCEKDHAGNTREAILRSRAMDEATDAISRLLAEIDETNAAIKEKKEGIKSAQDQLDAATKQREAEHGQWTINDRDDQAMLTLIQQATKVLQDYYEKNGMTFLQRKQPAEGAAGLAPPPPPATWDNPFGGHTQGAANVIAILETAAEDVKKDKEAAEADETKAAGQFTTFKTESEALIGELNKDLVDLDALNGQKEEQVGELKQTRTGLQLELNSAMAVIKSAAPGCDFLTGNFLVRRKNRQTERDGLLKAKAILSGGTFSFLQRRDSNAHRRRGAR